jgi:hypothetical protein
MQPLEGMKPPLLTVKWHAWSPMVLLPTTTRDAWSIPCPTGAGRVEFKCNLSLHLFQCLGRGPLLTSTWTFCQEHRPMWIKFSGRLTLLLGESEPSLVLTQDEQLGGQQKLCQWLWPSLSSTGWVRGATSKASLLSFQCTGDIPTSLPLASSYSVPGLSLWLRHIWTPSRTPSPSQLAFLCAPTFNATSIILVHLPLDYGGLEDQATCPSLCPHWLAQCWHIISSHMFDEWRDHRHGQPRRQHSH